MNDEKRLNVMEKMNILEESWAREYKFTCYHTYLSEDERCGWKENDWKNIQTICRQIESLHWDDDIEFLKRCQAEAFCKLGVLYTEKGDFDCACEMLEKAAAIMEENSFHYTLPKYYILTYIYLAHAYTEKHCNDAKVEHYCEMAGALLEKMTKYKNQPSAAAIEWSPALAGILKVELIHIWIITKSNAYRREKNVHILRENKKIEKFLSEVWQEILNLEHNCTDGKVAADKWMKLWIRKQKDTYWATKGVYYKWLYFACKDSKYPIDRDDCFENAVNAFADGVKADHGNTISAGNIAALLYNYKTEIYSSPDNATDGDSDFLAKILDQLKTALKIKELNSVEEYIEFFLEMVFETDRNNMFALNLKAMCERKNSKTETYPYLTLRQSALKKRFDKMDAQLPWDSSDNTDKLRNIKVCIINLHAEVAQYMNEAVYPREKFNGLTVGHYTKTSVLPRLLNREDNSRLRIRNVKHLNDPSEGALFMGYMNQQMADTDRTAAVCGYENSGSLIRSLLQIYEYKRREEWNQKSSVYMGCFTSRIDQLNMWSRYGDSGKGCCLCINADESFDESTAVPLAEISMEEDTYRYKMEDNEYPLYMVLYLPRNTAIDLKVVKEYATKRKEAEAVKREKLEELQTENRSKMPRAGIAAKERKRCAEEECWWDAQMRLTGKFGELIMESSLILKQIQEEYQHFVLKMKDAEMADEQWAILEEEIINTLMMILDQVRFLIKDDSYRDEREYRVIQYSYDPEYESGEDIPKLYVNIEKDLKYKTVVFGPLTQNYASDSAYVLNMRKKTPEKTSGKSLGLDVYKSDIPYCR